MSSSKGLWIVAAAAAIGVALSATDARADTISYTINGATTTQAPYSITTNPWAQTIALGTLPSPSTDTLVDQFTTALAATTSITDTWTFMIPPSVGGTSFSGDQISLSNLAVSGLVDSFAVWSGTPGSGTQLTPLSTTNGVSTWDLSQTGTYYIQVMSTLNANSVGNYSVNLVAAPIPEPSSAALSIAGLAAVGLLIGLRPRRRPQ
ncbi:MAG: hypothetical protein JO133_13345 [Burkholderiaceae bacterium]|nr:hypothetical protein [Burkholderiaceae bacterium]